MFMSSSSLSPPPIAPPCPLPDYRVQIAERVANLNAADWDGLRADRSDLFMDRSFITAVENSLQCRERVWSAIVYDGLKPVASACFSFFAVDAALLAPGWVKRGVAVVRRLFPGYLKFKILCCGLPVSASQSHLLFAADADRAGVLRLLDKQMRRARQDGAKILLFKGIRRSGRQST